MVIVVFRSRIKMEHAEEYYARADDMAAIAMNMPGFIAYKTYHADDGERVSIHEWESEEHLLAWRNHPAHRKMQAYGREHFYLEYTSCVLSPLRESRFTATS